MAEDHFTLDVDLESLRAAQRWLGTLAGNVDTEGTAMGNVPADLGDSWTGPAATKIKAEMSAMSRAVKRFGPDLESARDGVKAFADAVEVFRTTTLVDYNTRWNTAQQNASDDIAAAEEEHQDDEDKLGARRGEIASGLRYTLQGIDHQFSEEKRTLATKARQMGAALAGSSPVDVPDSVATRFVNGGGSGTHISWTDDDGDFPPDLDANAHLGGMTLSEDSDQQDAGEEAAAALEGLQDPADYEDYIASLNGESEAFRAAFLANLDPQVLADLHHTISDRPDDADGGELVTAIATILARGSTQDYGTAYPVSSTLYDDLVEAYTEIEDEYDPHAGAQGYLRLSELVAAGQGQPPTWDSDFLAEVTRRTIAFEREQVEIDDYWSWGTAGGEMYWNTAKGSDWYGDDEETDNPYWADPLVLYFEAMADDTGAAQQVFTNGTDSLDQDLSEYLYGRHAGHPGNYGWALSQVLQSATDPVGPGGEGTPDHVSAQIVSDLVGYYADHEVGLNMEDGIVNILTNHVQAVNHATDGNTGYQGLVVESNANSNYPHEWVTKANLTQEDLDSLLGRVFGLDYYSNDIAEDRDPPEHDFPLYTQLALAMELAARDEVHYVAQHGDPGQLEVLVNDLSSSQQRTLNAFTEALESQGRDADQRNADSRAALDFVLGIAKEAVPTERLGPAEALSGPGLDHVQGLLVDAIIPESAYEEAAAEDASIEDYRQQLTSLKLVKWLEEAGTLPQENSPQQWAEDNPEFGSFVVDGELTDPGELYRNRDQDPEAWNDFMRYYENSGRAWLAEIDLDEQYTLGWLEEGG